MNWKLRIGQWVIALHRAQMRVPWLGLVRAVLSGVVPRAVWRARLRYGCYQCPLFGGKEYIVCRGTVPPFDQHGCDCYLPFKALTADPHGGGCYGRNRFGSEFGWGAYVFRSRWERLWSPIRFLLRR